MSDINNKDPQKYHGMKYRLFFVGFIIDVAILIAMLFCGLSDFLKGVSSSIATHSMIINVIYIILFGLTFYVIHLPINIFSGYIWEHKFGLSNQSLIKWILDNLKKSVLGLLLSIVLVSVIYWFIGRFETYWWIAAGTFWLLISFVLAKLTPSVIVPLFYKYTDIENDALKQKIRQLFKECRTSLNDIYAIDFSSKTKKANAFICGLGRSRRVVLSDTLLAEFNDEEIEVVVAHELGHYHHKDILKMLFLNTIMIFCGFFIIDKILKNAVVFFEYEGFNDIASLPLFVLVFSIFGLIVTPLTNWYSCRMEVAADRFSLEKTQNPDGFISLMDKLGQMNLADFKPSRWIEIFFYDHPPIAKRIEFAKHFKQ